MVNHPEPIWWQYSLILPMFQRGYHAIDSYIVNVIDEQPLIKTGILHLFLQHTSASLLITENCCDDVKKDLEIFYDQLSPDSDTAYQHNLEGPDDMPAHIKNSLLGTSLTIPLMSGKPALGRWQGIYLAEHRDKASHRQIIMTAYGTSASFYK